MITWLFDSPERLKAVIGGGLAAVLIFGFTFLILSAGGPTHPDAPAPTGNPSSPAAAGPLPDETPEPTREYGSSGSVAMEAAEAFLRGDRSRFAALASPGVVEQVNEIPAPGGRISGDVVTLLGGPTQQQVQVPTTKGDLTMIMLIMDERWQVSDLEYAK